MRCQPHLLIPRTTRRQHSISRFVTSSRRRRCIITMRKLPSRSNDLWGRRTVWHRNTFESGTIHGLVCARHGMLTGISTLTSLLRTIYDTWTWFCLSGSLSILRPTRWNIGLTSRRYAWCVRLVFLSFQCSRITTTPTSIQKVSDVSCVIGRSVQHSSMRWSRNVNIMVLQVSTLT